MTRASRTGNGRGPARTSGAGGPAGLPLANRTQRSRLHAVDRFYAWAVRRGLVSANPAADLELPRKTKPLPDYLTPEEAAARTLSPHEQAFSDKLRRNAVVGSVDQVVARLNELAKRLDLDELVIVTWTYDPAPRHRSYELLAQAFELEKAHSA